MHRVLEVDPQDGDDDKLHWREKIWFSKREWDGQITDRRENDRIAWKTTRGTQHSGIVSFHRLDDNLTRVLVTVDFRPTGMMEKTASGLRFAKRAVQSDLARFKAYVEFDDAEELEYGNSAARDKNGKSGRDRDKSDDERDEERRSRESRRKERRESVGSK
jgi:uncharacterized membrane protein